MNKGPASKSPADIAALAQRFDIHQSPQRSEVLDIDLTVKVDRPAKKPAENEVVLTSPAVRAEVEQGGLKVLSRQEKEQHMRMAS